MLKHKTLILFVAILLAPLLVPFNVMFADDDQGTDTEGLRLVTMYMGTYPANKCSVVAYIKDIRTIGNASRYTVGYTGPGGQCDHPPYYNICLFNRFGPDGFYYIPCESQYRWRFYAKRKDDLSGQTYYSDWSKEMAYYPPDHLYDLDTLYITNQTSPPDPIPPYYAEE